MSEQENREVEEVSTAAGSEGASPPAASSEKQAQDGGGLHAAELAPSERPRLMGRVSGGPQRKETLGWARPDALNAEQRLLILDAWQRYHICIGLTDTRPGFHYEVFPDAEGVRHWLEHCHLLRDAHNLQSIAKTVLHIPRWRQLPQGRVVLDLSGSEAADSP